ncbi:uncharacterized protein [Drosophila bipectinata]|uniref:uncharacterized protein n=1 Tax=Drosophila bipectinata TaxID=42026 RepID=UPI001C8A50AC|nr:uncharacterized protein LOC108129065 [Drosophila bipectinata]
MSRKTKIIYSDIAAVSRGLFSIGKPASINRLSKYLSSMLGIPSWMLVDDLKILLETYEPLGFFKKEKELYWLPADLLQILSEQERERQAKQVVPPVTVAPPSEPDVVYGYTSEIDLSRSLRHPYLHRFR